MPNRHYMCRGFKLDKIGCDQNEQRKCHKPQ